VAIERSSQWLILTSSEVIPGQYDICSSFQRLANRCEKFIYFLPAIAVNSTARGPPISVLGKYVQKVRVFFPELLFKNINGRLVIRV
jgi:hypothetical protein